MNNRNSFAMKSAAAIFAAAFATTGAAGAGDPIDPVLAEALDEAPALEAPTPAAVAAPVTMETHAAATPTATFSVKSAPTMVETVARPVEPATSATMSSVQEAHGVDGKTPSRLEDASQRQATPEPTSVGLVSAGQDDYKAPKWMTDLWGDAVAKPSPLKSTLSLRVGLCTAPDLKGRKDKDYEDGNLKWDDGVAVGADLEIPQTDNLALRIGAMVARFEGSYHEDVYSWWYGWYRDHEDLRDVFVKGTLEGVYHFDVAVNGFRPFVSLGLAYVFEDLVTSQNQTHKNRGTDATWLVRYGVEKDTDSYRFRLEGCHVASYDMNYFQSGEIYSVQFGRIISGGTSLDLHASHATKSKENTIMLGLTFEL